MGSNRGKADEDARKASDGVSNTWVDPDAEKLWQAEILRRAREIDEGSVQLIPWSELRSELNRPV